jgi:hypothetical protein
LGGPFLSFNHIVIDHDLQTCIDKKTGYDLLNPPHITQTTIKPHLVFGPELKKLQKSVVANIKSLLPKTYNNLNNDTPKPCLLAAIQTQIETLVIEEQLRLKDAEFKAQYLDLFPPDVPDVVDLLDHILMSIKLKDDLKPMVVCAYSCPRKYREGWKTLIQQHLTAGCICPSNSNYVSPAFIVPKADPTVLPRWVNDYRKLNANTIADTHLSVKCTGLSPC